MHAICHSQGMAECWECWAPWAAWHRPPVSLRASEPRTRERLVSKTGNLGAMSPWLQVYQRWRWHHLQPLDLISHRLRWARSEKSLNGFGQDWGIAMPGNLGNFQHLAVDLGVTKCLQASKETLFASMTSVTCGGDATSIHSQPVAWLSLVRDGRIV